MTDIKHQLKTIVLRDLQPILRRAFDDQLIVVRYTTKSLLPPGENYGSTILSVHAVIKRDDQADEEDLYLVAKMTPPTEFQREIFDSPYTFRKEIFMYENILPHYNQMEREIGMKEDELFNILPKYYQSRLSLDPEVDFDDDAVILMENLKSHGYYIGDRTKGYDLEHSRVAIRAMARFHAMGMATKYKKPEYFAVLKKHSMSLELKLRDSADALYEGLLKKMSEDSEINKYIDRCKVLMTKELCDTLFTALPDEPWSTIIHADFWVNNIMFHRDEEGRVDDIKFVDFQNYLFLSPLREMIFYIFSSTNEEVQDNHVDELIDLYHETLLAVMERMGCNTRPFSRDKFNAKLPSDVKLEFVHLCFMMKVLTMDAQKMNFNYDKIQSVMISYAGNDALLHRLRKIVLYFVKHDWI